MAVITQSPEDNSSIVRIAGAFVAIFSLVVSLLVLFVIPGACTFVGGLQLLILGLLFILGAVAFVIGTIFSRKRRPG